jgi:hypothetical protein
MTTQTTSRQVLIDYAISLTRKATEAKDWQLRSKRNLKLREIAKEMISGKGYILATHAKMKEMFPDTFTQIDQSDDTTTYIWAIEFGRNVNTWRFQIGFVPIF